MTEISVIMPNYNGAAGIKRSLNCVISQTFQDLELVVVDDGSDDDSVSIIRSLKDPRIKIRQQVHQGVCAARNLGITAAKGKYIAFLDSDDTWDNRFLEELHRALVQFPRAALAYCGWQNLGLPGRRCDPFIPPDYEGERKIELWLEGCRWPIHAVLVKRDAIMDVGGFDRRYPTSEDYYLWLRIVSKHPIVRVPQVLAYYHHHEGLRATQNRSNMAIDHWRVQRAFLSNNPELDSMISPDRKRRLTHGELLQRGNEAYWSEDLPSARKIFRLVMRHGYGTWSDWLRMLPSVLPIRLHRTLADYGNLHGCSRFRRRRNIGIR
jgi:glycosyltransferase involved in cell wall biosynthesis